jgi:phage terminase large subunit
MPPPPGRLDLPSAFRPLFADAADDGHPVRYRAFYGGRGSAKSHSIAAALLVKARQRPLTILCAREIQRSIRDSVKRLLDRKIDLLGFGPAGDGFYQSLDSEIRGRNGTLITFAGLRSNIDSIQSMEGVDIAYVSEARSVSQASLDILGPTIRAPGSEIWFDWNPRSPKDPVDAMFRGKGGPPPRSILRKVNWDQNPWFPDELREDMEWDRRRDPDKYAHIWLGEYQRNSEARVFRNWRVEAFDTPADARFYHGADWGFSVDPTVLVRCFVDGRTLYVDREVYKVGCEIDRTPALFDRMETARPQMADPGRQRSPRDDQLHAAARLSRSPRRARAKARSRTASSS